MIITPEHFDEARERAEKELAHRTEDDAWAVLEDIIEAEAQSQRERMMHILTTEAIRDMLYPSVTREQWRKLGWNDALGGRMPPAKFIHKLRLAKAAGSETGRL